MTTIMLWTRSFRIISSRFVSKRPFSSFASLNGVPSNAALLRCSVWDQTFQRGDGVFEVCRVVSSKPRCLHLHLDRLERSAAAIDLKLPPRNDLKQWLFDAAKQGGDGIIRCIVTRGGGSPGYGHHLGQELDAPPSTFILWQPLPAMPDSLRLLPMCVPWHCGGFNVEDWAAVKWLSYGANLHSTRLAQKRGYNDALLLARGDGSGDEENDSQRVILDGPNFAVAWIRNDGTFCTPSWRELGLLQSTSCTIALQAAQRMGVPVEEGIYFLADVERHATAIYVMSTTRDLIPVIALGTTEFPTDSKFRANLLNAMDSIVDEHD